MTAYLDTSALVKLYVNEPGTAEVQRLVDRATRLSTSQLTYVEARAAFARRLREGRVSHEGYLQLVRLLEHEWEFYLRLDVSEQVVKLAGQLAERHGLRAYDAVQLASALSVQPRAVVEFIAADGPLLKAAAQEGLLTSRVPA